ncbi:glycosyltransferase family 4 protein [Pontiellaceae bacterium B12219]|nr:glycosyltransferase family 4 protein [Pontiellaceae bacterium B12219]
MKILFLANRLPHADVAGGHRLIHQRMKQLINHGHSVGLAAFVAEENEAFIPALQQELYEVKTLPLKKQYLAVRVFHDYISSAQPAIFWKNYSKSMMRLVGDMVEQTRYDVVVAEFSEMGMYLYRNPYLSAVHKVVSCHRCLTTSFSKYMETAGVPWALRLKSASQVRVLERCEFEMYSAMDHILTLTAEDRFTLLHHAPQLPVSVIPPGIDFDYLDRETHVSAPEPIIMMCGYFADKSNHDGAMWFLEEIWPLVKQKHPEARCQFVGAGANIELKRVAKKQETIQVIDRVDDLRPYREQAAIFVNPMRLGSGLRIKMLEAMATSLPVVSTALGAAGIRAQNGENCFIADTPELFAQSIDWLLTDKKLAHSMGQHARQLVKEHHDILNTSREFEKVLSEVVAVKR